MYKEEFPKGDEKKRRKEKEKERKKKKKDKKKKKKKKSAKGLFEKKEPFFSVSGV